MPPTMGAAMGFDDICAHARLPQNGDKAGENDAYCH